LRVFAVNFFHADIADLKQDKALRTLWQPIFKKENFANLCEKPLRIFAVKFHADLKEENPLRFFAVKFSRNYSHKQ
jgi:hypothetical protein